jgi:Ca2+-binding EF-hand superfamily protein
MLLTGAVALAGAAAALAQLAPAGAGGQAARQEGGTPRPLVTPKAVDQEQTFFEQCDRDQGGWISFVEAREALGITRDEFFSFDRDRDARIDREEWSQRYRTVVERTGGFPTPKVSASAGAAPPRSAEQLRNAFDTDFDGGLGAAELAQFLKDYPIPGLTPPLILSQLDANGDLRLDLGEVGVLAALLDTFRQQLGPAALRPERATSVLELFGQPEERGNNALPEPPRLAGPLPVFERLDTDHDGFLSDKDFFELQYPLTLPVRGAGVIAALDRDGDGRLSLAEFQDALGNRGAPRPAR